MNKQIKRTSRVNIVYEVRKNGAIEKVELPFVNFVLSDLSGKSLKDKGDLSDREIQNIEGREALNKYMRKVEPRAAGFVKNVISKDGNPIPFDLTFKDLDDFRPEAIGENTEGLSELLKKRRELSALLNFVDGKAKAEEILSNLLKSPDLMRLLASQDESNAPRASDKD